MSRPFGGKKIRKTNIVKNNYGKRSSF
jgi:hypothetical protein